jgi:predicted transcriptional regulator
MMNVDTSDAPDEYAGEDGISPTLDATLDLLSDRRRRYVLYALRKRSGAVALDELAEQIASWEDDAEADHVRTDLYHSHLPQMENTGVVSFDADAELVGLADCDSSPVEEYLDLAADAENVA